MQGLMKSLAWSYRTAKLAVQEKMKETDQARKCAGQ